MRKRIPGQRWVAWGALAALLAVPATSFAWGDLGHSVVGEIAERLLAKHSPKAYGKLRTLLAKSGRTLAEGATWPDHMRSDADFRNTNIASWHFCDTDEKGAVTVKVNAVWALEMAESVLTGRKPPYEVPRKKPKLGSPVIIDQEKAIYFIAHLVGDIHQPLHVGNTRDHGANDCLVKWFGSARRDEGFWNLHTVWDEGLLEKAAIGRTDFAGDLLRRLDATKPETFLTKTSALEWAQESAAIRPQVYPQLDAAHPAGELTQPYCLNPKYRNLPGKYAGSGADSHVIDAGAMARTSDQILGDREIPRLGYDYRAEHIELAKMQLLKAGVRLAYVLERSLID